MSGRIPYVPSPWDAFGPPQVRDVDLPEGELEETWACLVHEGEHATRATCLIQLETELPDAERDVRYAEEDLERAEEWLEEVRDGIAELSKARTVVEGRSVSALGSAPFLGLEPAP